MLQYNVSLIILFTLITVALWTQLLVRDPKRITPDSFVVRNTRVNVWTVRLFSWLMRNRVASSRLRILVTAHRLLVAHSLHGEYEDFYCLMHKVLLRSINKLTLATNNTCTRKACLKWPLFTKCQRCHWYCCCYIKTEQLTNSKNYNSDILSRYKKKKFLLYNNKINRQMWMESTSILSYFKNETTCIRLNRDFGFHILHQLLPNVFKIK